MRKEQKTYTPGRVGCVIPVKSKCISNHFRLCEQVVHTSAINLERVLVLKVLLYRRFFTLALLK